jgi:hypothetical protein
VKNELKDVQDNNIDASQLLEFKAEKWQGAEYSAEGGSST